MAQTYFTDKELACPCCGLIVRDPVAWWVLNKARHIAGVPFRLTSATRCLPHNCKVGGVDASDHVYGTGFDVEFKSSTELYAIMNGAMLAGFTRVFIYPKKGIIHLGISDIKDEFVMKVKL